VTRRLDFRDHRRELDANRYVYAVMSRRARGLSIGINLNPDKACNFACPYCQVDRTTPGGPPRVEVGVLQAELVTLLDGVRRGTIWTRSPFDTVAPGMRRLADVAFSGDGEPTTFKNFDQIVNDVAGIKRGRGLDAVKLVLITNASMFHRPNVQRALAILDANQGEIWAKLDAGTADYYHLVDRTPISFERIIENLKEAAQVRPLVIQSLFMRIEGVGPTRAEISAFCDRLNEILAAGGAIDRVQVYTVARRPAESYVSALEPEEVDAIAQAVKSAVNVPIESFYGAAV
jgi:wyosine [tRNA(Phe)-imidazoG37] synthetase (radical SAM superfamily)